MPLCYMTDIIEHLCKVIDGEHMKWTNYILREL